MKETKWAEEKDERERGWGSTEETEVKSYREGKGMEEGEVGGSTTRRRGSGEEKEV